MSEMSSVAVFCGNHDTLERIRAFVQEQFPMAEISDGGDQLRIEKLTAFYDYNAYDQIKKIAPESMLVSYEFSYTVGEPEFCVSNYNKTYVHYIAPFDYEDDEDEYFDDDEDEEFDEDEEDEEDEEESTWYQDCYDEVGGEGMRILRQLVDEDSAYLLKGIPEELFE